MWLCTWQTCDSYAIITLLQHESCIASLQQYYLINGRLVLVSLIRAHEQSLYLHNRVICFHMQQDTLIEQSFLMKYYNLTEIFILFGTLVGALIPTHHLNIQFFIILCNMMIALNKFLLCMHNVMLHCVLTNICICYRVYIVRACMCMCVHFCAHKHVFR